MAPSDTQGLGSSEQRPSNPLIRKLEGFGSLPESDRRFLAQISAKTYCVAAGAALVREGDAPPGVFLIMEGLACRAKVRASGARQIMAYLLPGDAGDLNVPLLKQMDHTISALSDCQVVCLLPETIREVMAHPNIVHALRLSTLVDAATLREWLMNIGRRTGEERLAHLFCELLVRYGVVGMAEGNNISLALTQRDLADTTGLSVVHVNRILQELRARGFISLGRKRLNVLDLPHLRALAEFKDNYLHVGDQAAA